MIRGVFVLCFWAVLLAPAQKLAITFDDLPRHGELPAGVSRVDVAKSILGTLHAVQAPPVYGFINAKKLADEPDLGEVLSLWMAAGNPLASHTWSHPDLSNQTAEAFIRDAAANEPALQKLMGDRDWHWFRYPFLHEGDTLEKRREVRAWILQHGYRIAQVTLDFEDYAWNNPYARCLAKGDQASVEWLRTSHLETARENIAAQRGMARQIFGREISHVLLLHIGAFDALVFPELLEQLRASGFSLVSLEEAERDQAYQTDPNAALKYGGTLLEQIFEARHMKSPPHNERPLKKLDALCR